MFKLCAQCKRHARASAESCPFCNGALSEANVGSGRAGGATRAAQVLGTAAIVGIAACTSSVQPAYGLPPVMEKDAAPDAIQALYGGPPMMDAGPDAKNDAESAQPAYGISPMLDSGSD
jgi:hypothetical protein